MLQGEKIKSFKQLISIYTKKRPFQREDRGNIEPV